MFNPTVSLQFYLAMGLYIESFKHNPFHFINLQRNSRVGACLQCCYKLYRTDEPKLGTRLEIVSDGLDKMQRIDFYVNKNVQQLQPTSDVDRNWKDCTQLNIFCSPLKIWNMKTD